MENRSYCSREKSMPATKRVALCRPLFLALSIAWFAMAIVPQRALAGDAPQWMHALVGWSFPAYDEKTSAVLLYSDTNATVLSADKVRTRVREAYKILRPEGR